MIRQINEDGFVLPPWHRSQHREKVQRKIGYFGLFLICVVLYLKQQKVSRLLQHWICFVPSN
eukprot:06713.XXX_33258_33443_1 [CDS] Oithona nana genome sequencing.